MKGGARIGVVALTGLSVSCVFWDAGSWSSRYGAGGGDASPAPSGQPEVMATVGMPWGIAVDSDRMYFSSSQPNGAVYSCPLAGCGASPTVLASGLASPSRLVLDGANVYWANFDDGSIASCPKIGCPAGPTILARQQSGPVGIAVDAKNVYWANAVSASTGGSVSSCPLAGCPASGPKILAANEDYPFAVAVDASGLYWANTGGEVRSCNPDACGRPSTLITGQGNLQNVLLSQGILYWANRAAEGSGGAVSSCSTSNCTETAGIVAKADEPLGMAIDATSLYWASFTAGGSVHACPLSGCGADGPVVVTSSLNQPFGVAVDASYVYVTLGVPTGKVLRVPKPRS